MAFVRLPSSESVIGTRGRVTTSPLVYYSPKFKLQLEVLEGYVSDFASTPRILWPIMPPSGPYSPAAILHDALYSGNIFATDRKRADDLFLEAILSLKPVKKQAKLVALARKAQAYAMYWGVRLAGWLPYGKYSDYVIDQTRALVNVATKGYNRFDATVSFPVQDTET